MSDATLPPRSPDDDGDVAATAAAPAPGRGALTTQLQVPPWVQLVGLPLVVLFGYLFVRAASHAVVVFLIAALISLLLAPVVRSLVAVGIPRLLSVLLVFGTFAATVTVLTIGMINLVAEQASEVRRSSDDIGAVAVERIDDLQGFADDRGWNVDLRDQGVQFVEQLEERSTELSGRALEFGREFVAVLAEAAFNLVLVIVITIYMLLDAPRISRLFVSVMPERMGIGTLFSRMERSLLRFTIGQTLASLVMGVSAAIGFWVMGVTGIWDAGDEYAVLFGVIVALTEFAPSIGPVIGAVIPVATALLDGVGPAIAVALFFLLLHQIEGHIVIPKLMGAAIAVHPLLVIFGIVAGAQIMGIGGILLALPLLAVGREIVMFVRERVTLGEWPSGPVAPVLSTAAVAGGAPPPVPAPGAAVPATLRTRVLPSRLRSAIERRRARRDGGRDAADADDVSGSEPDA